MQLGYKDLAHIKFYVKSHLLRLFSNIKFYHDLNFFFNSADKKI